MTKEGFDISTILVTGGAGYIGSHTAYELVKKGHSVVVVDNLSRGHLAAVPRGALFYKLDLNDVAALTDVMKKRRVDSVIHFAAYALVGESMEKPLDYYRNNVVGTCCLLEAMRAAGVKNIIFSSSCSVYGVPKRVPITENHPLDPVSPYGETKAAVERMLKWYSNTCGFASISLRYFNAAGAHPKGLFGEDHEPETHLIPNILRAALGEADAVSIFGNDYSTKDGTCVRDYVHVNDLAAAHVRALSFLKAGKADSYNLGTGKGHSVLEAVKAARRVTRREILIQWMPRRAGDPPILVADPSRIKREFGWKPRFFSLDEIIKTAWKWHRVHPHGYA